MPYDTQFYLNLFGIGLEIPGFIILLLTIKKLEFGGGGYAGPEPRDPKTQKPVKDILGFQHLNWEKAGIVMIIIGLAFQIGALFQ